MIKYKIFFIFLAYLSGLVFPGCLSVETKEYTFKLKSGNSGEGKIKFINIMRSYDSLGTVESDYEDLLNTYLKGNKPEDEMLGVKNVKKRLFEEDNKLCGEFTFDFDDITKLKFYTYNNIVWCYYTGSAQLNIFGGESYFSSNGTYGGENVPVIFWDGSQKKFEFKTTSTQPSDKTTSLLDIWKTKGE